MKFPVSMLRDYVETALDADALGDLLTMAGFELEGIEEVDGEPVLDIKVMSNRGDGLSVYGLAREVLAKDPNARATALAGRARARFNSQAVPANQEVGVRIETPDCTRYACLILRGVTNGEAPEWVQERLTKAGMRPISLLVDLTNYVMLELGQPLHAFDLAKLHGPEIIVRSARPGERLKTLNGDEHELKDGQMMICDADRPVAAAGIMGGEETEVGADTKDVLLESAHFVNTSVRRTRKQLGLSTEASYRFERSVDPEGVVAALERFAELLAEAGQGSTRVSGANDVYPVRPTPPTIALDLDLAQRRLGMEIGASEARRYLEALGFAVSPGGDEVNPPTWRPDVVRPEDVFEELARVHGYDRIPSELPSGRTTLGRLDPVTTAIKRVRETMVRLGFVQTISHSLRDLSPLDPPNADGAERLGPRNPGSPELAYLRASLLPNLADAARRNGGRDLHLFEIGRTFRLRNGQVDERRTLAALSTGALFPTVRAGQAVPEADFFSLKGSLEALFAKLGVRVSFEPGGEADPRLHPTRRAVLVTDTGSIGLVAQIHPEVAEACGLPAATVLAELDLEAVAELAQAAEPKLKPISRNPAVRRDISVLLPKDVPYETVEHALAVACGEVLERQWLFDVYEGQGVPAGSHALAVALQLRKFGENFTDEEANQVRERAAEALVALGGTLR